MRKMTLKHVDSISHAERYAIPNIVPNMSPRHRQEIEDDLERLAEVKQQILHMIYHPGLPLADTEIKEDPTRGNQSSSG